MPRAGLGWSRSHPPGPLCALPPAQKTRALRLAHLFPAWKLWIVLPFLQDKVLSVYSLTILFFFFHLFILNSLKFTKKIEWCNRQPDTPYPVSQLLTFCHFGFLCLFLPVLNTHTKTHTHFFGLLQISDTSPAVTSACLLDRVFSHVTTPHCPT